MTTSRMRTTLWSVAAGLLATTAIAFTPSLAASPASAGDKPACAKQSPAGSSDKKCPSPTPSPTASVPQGNETGCRDLTYGSGQYRGVEPAPTAGTVLEFQMEVDFGNTPTCPEVTYTVIARDMDTLAELGRFVQQGNGLTATLATVINLPTYRKPAIAVDVIVADGDVVDDIAPNTRPAVGPWGDLTLNGTGPQSWN